MNGHQHRWLAGGYDLEIGHILRWITWWLAVGKWLFCAVFIVALIVARVRTDIYYIVCCRLTLLGHYIAVADDSVPCYNLAVFLRPDRFVQAILQMYARKEYKDLHACSLDAQVISFINHNNFLNEL